MLLNNSKIIIFISRSLNWYIAALSWFTWFINENNSMRQRILKICYAVIMALIFVALITFMVIHIKAGLADVNAKIMLSAYVLMLFWAGYRLYALIKELLRG